MHFRCFLVAAFRLGHVTGLRLNPEPYTRSSPFHACVADYSSKLNRIEKGLGDGVTTRVRELTSNIGPRTKLQQKPIIFGAGFGDTATRSLHSALRLMGHKGEHNGQTNHKLAGYIGRFSRLQHHDSNCLKKMKQLFPNKFEYRHGYMLDAPTAELFLDLYVTFPNAKFIYTGRNSTTWAQKRYKAHHGKKRYPGKSV